MSCARNAGELEAAGKGCTFCRGPLLERLQTRPAGTNTAQWCLEAYAPKFAGRPLLVITLDDGFAPGSEALAGAVERDGGEKLVAAHFRSVHSYSGHRIALQIRC